MLVAILTYQSRWVGTLQITPNSAMIGYPHRFGPDSQLAASSLVDQYGLRINPLTLTRNADVKRVDAEQS